MSETQKQPCVSPESKGLDQISENGAHMEMQPKILIEFGSTQEQRRSGSPPKLHPHSDARSCVDWIGWSNRLTMRGGCGIGLE